MANCGPNLHSGNAWPMADKKSSYSVIANRITYHWFYSPWIFFFLFKFFPIIYILLFKLFFVFIFVRSKPEIIRFTKLISVNVAPFPLQYSDCDGLDNGHRLSVGTQEMYKSARSIVSQNTICKWCRRLQQESDSGSMQIKR